MKFGTGMTRFLVGALLLAGLAGCASTDSGAVTARQRGYSPVLGFEFGRDRNLMEYKDYLYDKSNNR